MAKTERAELRMPSVRIPVIGHRRPTIRSPGDGSECFGYFDPSRWEIHLALGWPSKPYSHRRVLRCLNHEYVHTRDELLGEMLAELEAKVRDDNDFAGIISTLTGKGK